MICAALCKIKGKQRSYNTIQIRGLERLDHESLQQSKRRGYDTIGNICVVLSCGGDKYSF